jgi:hypothetical protein
MLNFLMARDKSLDNGKPENGRPFNLEGMKNVGIGITTF